MASSNKPLEIGENVKVETTDDEIIIRIKRAHRGNFNGKTIRVASTLGNKQVTQEGIIVGLNAYVYPKAE